MTGPDQLYFEDLESGQPMPPREFGPLTINDTVRWAGVQENFTERIHWDREFAREHSGLRDFIASGAYRQALLARAITDWIGPRGVLRRLRLRHTHPTFEGDVMRFSAKVAEKSAGSGRRLVTCELLGENQDGRQIMFGQCTVELPSRHQA